MTLAPIRTTFLSSTYFLRLVLEKSHLFSYFLTNGAAYQYLKCPIGTNADREGCREASWYDHSSTFNRTRMGSRRSS